jgi:hypothetical protein
VVGGLGEFFDDLHVAASHPAEQGLYPKAPGPTPGASLVLIDLLWQLYVSVSRWGHTGRRNGTLGSVKGPENMPLSAHNRQIALDYGQAACPQTVTIPPYSLHSTPTRDIISTE